MIIQPHYSDNALISNVPCINYVWFWLIIPCVQLKDIALVFSSILSFQPCSFQEIHRKKCTHVFEKRAQMFLSSVFLSKTSHMIK